MNSHQHKELVEQLIHAMRGDQSHVDFDSAVADFPIEQAGVKLDGAPHTAWELLEHLRITLHDLLEFSRDPNYKSPEWPEGYWPKIDAPPNQKAWQASVDAFREHAKAMEDLVSDPNQDLFKKIESGTGQTLLREALVAAAHNSYHLGQLVYLKKALLKK